MRSRVMSIVIYLLISYILVLLMMALLQGKILFHPTPYPGLPTEYKLNDFSEVKIKTEDGAEISGWFKKADKPGKVILLFYGNADSLNNYADFFRKLADAGYTVLGLNYRGYGGMKGKPTEQGLYEDGRAAVKFLSQYDEEKNIIFVGRSLGSGVAVEMASKHKLKGLVLISPYTSIVNIAGEIYWYLPVKYVSRYKFSSIDKIASVKEPILIIHGDQDRLIPISHAERLLNTANARKELKVYKGSDHNDLDMNRMASDIIEFFEDKPHAN